jgi:hypothetical protein
MAMPRKKEMTREDAEKEVSVWLADAQSNIEDAVNAFMDQWQPWPVFDVGVEVMDLCRLRGAIGVRATMDYGDPWPSVERRLLDAGFRWHSLGNQRVMYLKERDGFVPDTGWEDAEEV